LFAYREENVCLGVRLARKILVDQIDATAQFAMHEQISCPSAWAKNHRKPQTKPSRAEPNRNFGFFGFRFRLRFCAAGSSVFGSVFGSTVNCNRNTEATEQSIDLKWPI
jgi:hypothetical protein